MSVKERIEVARAAANAWLLKVWNHRYSRRVIRTVFSLYVAVNMLLCAIIFIGRSFPRETISGYIGRRIFGCHYWALHTGRFIDWLYREPGPCGETALAEEQMRIELYPMFSEEENIAEPPSA